MGFMFIAKPSVLKTQLTVAELPLLTHEGGRAASMGLRSLSQEAPPP